MWLLKFKTLAAGSGLLRFEFRALGLPHLSLHDAQHDFALGMPLLAEFLGAGGFGERQDGLDVDFYIAVHD